MATAKRQPSGNWRVIVYDGIDKKTGKKVYTAISGKTKKEAEIRAGRHLDEVGKPGDIREITVGEAIERYIYSKEKILSPSSIRSYRSLQNTHFGRIEDKLVYNLTTEDMQLFVASLVGKVSAKSIGNIYGLLTSAIYMFRPDAVFRTTLPKKPKARRSAPSDDDVKELFTQAGEELKVCIALAAFGSMRRGEICALKHKDIDGRIAHVHADMVQSMDGFVYKDFPKTSESIRSVLLPQQVIDLIGDGPDDAYVTLSHPDRVTHRFNRLRNKLGIDIRFHDLRHYYASIGAVLGIPDIYLAEFGGWRHGSPVMKAVYQNKIDIAADKYSNKMSDHFSGLITGESKDITISTKDSDVLGVVGKDNRNVTTPSVFPEYDTSDVVIT